MFKGSLYGRWEAIVTFTVMIVLADQEGEVDMTPEALAASTSIPLEIIRRGLEYLEAPDPQSRTPDEEGRRIIRVSDSRDWGWRITNYAHYRKMRTAEERREYFKQHKRKQRAKKSPRPPVSTTSPQSPPIAEGEGEVEGKAVKRARAQHDRRVEHPDFDGLWSLYPSRAGGNSRSLAHKAFSARVAEGVPVPEMVAGVERYAAYCQATGNAGTQYVKQAASFFGPGEHWREPWTIPVGRGEARANGNRAVLDRFLEVAGGE